MNSSDHWIYAYPIALGFKKLEVSETFVTFDEPNLFVEPYDTIWIKLVATVIYLIGLGGCCIQYTFVVYEVNGYAASYRTVINQLVSCCYFLFATYTSVVSGLDLFRVWYGPLPPEFCQLCLLMKGTVGYTIPFIMASIVILKFLYICVWQGFREMDDDLVVRIIIILATFWGFYMQLIKNLAPGKPVYSTVFCTGVYQSSFDGMDKKIPTETGMLIPILIAQLITPFIYQKRKELNNIQTFKAKNQNIPNHESLTLYFICNICFILCVVGIRLCNVSEPFRWNEYPYNLYIFYIHFATGLQTGIIPAIFIINRKKISFFKEVLHEITE